ncbi:alpha/beta hydrolase [Mycolicibacterium mucogenicum]|uniref:alpha/beta hydrolase n=1 Tax=Mycolicibacterium mucogenicum TaxID=56689 RepID=UPI00226AE329|nr:alpha/beta hydrolase [Mycolicibacterium mucogenicum]MCX8560527.1 alpha/beta hydrolase [Mycolicibacterium mucogenicum]
MSLDPQVANLIEALDTGFPKVSTMTGAEARAAIRARFVPNPHPEPVATVRDERVFVDGGHVDIRIYRPDVSGLLPVLVYAHGGGFVFCDLDSHDGLCRNLANLTPAVVVSVGYRLAPEHRWPTAAEDLYAVTRWVSEHADELGADAQRLAIGGDSAGGNLAAVTALMARDRGELSITAQMLLYPVIAAEFDTDSYRRFGAGYYNPREALQWYWDQYVPEPSDRSHPYASPLCGLLEGLPPAVVVLAGCDPLKDEGLAYADALRDAGGTVQQLFFAGGIHGFMTMPMFDIAHAARRQASRALAELLRR